MPPATRAETLVGIAEVIDGASPLHASDYKSGPALQARALSLPRFPPLGPPDILYMRKRYVPVVGASKLYGYYHFARGIDPSSVAAISAYIVDVVRNNGLDPLSWVSAGGWEVASATFVAYNLMSRADVIVHVDFPGSTSVKAFDAANRELVLDDLFWQECLVSSVVRDLSGHGEKPLYPCLRVLNHAMRAEPTFLDAAAACAHRWHLSGTDAMHGRTEIAAKSRVARIIRDHFLANARYDTAHEFFSRERLRAVDIRLWLYAAASSRMKGDLDIATRIVDDVLTASGESDLAWMERCRILRARGDVNKALDAARTAASYADDDVDVWVLLADLYVDTKQYSKAFEALNSADMPPPSLDPYLRELVPNRKNLTVPVEGASRGMDSVRLLAKKVREERTMANDKTDDTLSDLPARHMSDMEHNCYAVLVKILNDLSWDEMLSVRGECFVMETDVENGRLDMPDGEVVEQGESSEDEEEEGYVEDDEEQERAAQDSETDRTSEAEADAANGISTISLEDDDRGGSDMNGINDGAVGDLRKRALEKIGKKVCKPWLDYLVTNMYHDLRAMALWSAEEQQHSGASALAAAALARRSQSRNSDDERGPGESGDIESGESDHTFKRTAEEVLRTTKRPAADWLRRGELAFRLGKLEEAKTAFGVCVRLSEKEKNVAVTALCRLMKIAAADGATKTTLRCADAIWTYMDASTDRKQSSEPTPPVPEVRTAIFNLISKKGLRAVRDVVTDKFEVDRKRMESLLLDSVALRVDGFSR